MSRNSKRRAAHADADATAVDLRAGRRVGIRWMTAFGRAALCALLLASACGKDKKEDTTPDPANPGDGTRPEDVDPVGADDVPGGGPGDGPIVGGGDPADPDGTDDPIDPDDPDGDPGDGGSGALEPPTLDRAPAEVQRIVDKHMKAGVAAMRGNRPDDAIAEARKVLAENEVYVPGMILLAQAYYAKGFYDKAEAILDIAVKRPDGPTSERLHFLFGLVYDKTDRPEQALVSFEKAVRARPDYKNGLLNLGAKYLARKRYRDAVRVYETLTGQLGDNRAVVWNNLGSAYRGLSIDASADKLDALRRAESAYKRASTSDKNYAYAYYNLGILYLDAEKFPGPGGQPLDEIKRLERAKTYFRQYRGMSGADQDLVDDQVAVADKLIQREERRREAEKKREERRRKREERERKRAAEGAN